MGTYRILIIDDDSSQHIIIGEYLKLSGYEPLSATDGESGLEMLAAERPDLVLLDIQMPGMDGFQTLDRIRNDPAHRDVPVIFLTALDRDNLKIRGLKEGADDYITKPFNKAELLARITAVLRRTARYRRTEGMMDGDLSDVGLSELLQSMDLGSKTATILMPGMDAEVCVEDGYLVHVRQGEFTGTMALKRLFLLERGAFSVKFNILPADITKVPESLMSVLMGVLAEVDEVRELIRRARAEGRTVRILSGAGGALESFADGPPMPFLDLVAHIDGDLKENVRELIKASKQGKLKLVT